MRRRIVVPVWVLIAVWSVAGRIVAEPIIDEVHKATFLPKDAPKWVQRYFALPKPLKIAGLVVAVLLFGPWIWATFAFSGAQLAYEGKREAAEAKARAVFGFGGGD
jgi:hypothetical protein